MYQDQYLRDFSEDLINSFTKGVQENSVWIFLLKTLQDVPKAHLVWCFPVDLSYNVKAITKCGKKYDGQGLTSYTSIF